MPEGSQRADKRNSTSTEQRLRLSVGALVEALLRRGVDREKLEAMGWPLGLAELGACVQQMQARRNVELGGSAWLSDRGAA